MRDGSRPEEVVGRVEGEIDMLRNELGGLVAELDRRRHEALDLRFQARKHPVLAAAVATVVAVFVGGTIAFVVHVRRERRRPAVRARETRRALSRLFDHPNRVAAEPSMAIKIATAAGAALATALTKRLLDRAMTPSPRRRAGA